MFLLVSDCFLERGFSCLFILLCIVGFLSNRCIELFFLVASPKLHIPLSCIFPDPIWDMSSKTEWYKSRCQISDQSANLNRMVPLEILFLEGWSRGWGPKAAVGLKDFQLFRISEAWKDEPITNPLDAESREETCRNFWEIPEIPLRFLEVAMKEPFKVKP